MIRTIAAALLLSTLVLVACSSTQATRRQPPTQDAPVEFLLTSAAGDFHSHGPGYPLGFRDVRIGYAMTKDGEKQYMLCGDFGPAQGGGRDQWTPFVTIKTSGYEQWLGAQAKDFCRRSSMVWLDGDLTSALQARLDCKR